MERVVIHKGVVNRRENAWRAFAQEWQAYPILARPAALYRDSMSGGPASHLDTVPPDNCPHGGNAAGYSPG